MVEGMDDLDNDIKRTIDDAVDDADVCVPVGGFINSIRPISYVIKLMQISG